MSDGTEKRGSNPPDMPSGETKQFEVRPINDDRMLAELILNTIKQQVDDQPFAASQVKFSAVQSTRETNIQQLVDELQASIKEPSNKIYAVQGALRYITYHKQAPHNDEVIDLTPFSRESTAPDTFEGTPTDVNAVIPHTTPSAADKPEVLAEIKADPVRFLAYLVEATLENNFQQGVTGAYGFSELLPTLPQRRETLISRISTGLFNATRDLIGIRRALLNASFGVQPTIIEIRKDDAPPTGYRINLTPELPTTPAK